jgi:hypothetical protein
MTDSNWIAACGLDCEACEIRRLPFDENAAATCVAWYRKMGWLGEEEGVEDALAREMTCRGCHGDRSVHWSVEEDGICWILECCVDRRGHEHCSECEEFPCEHLVDWSKQNAGYGRAFGRLEQMADSAQGGRSEPGRR